MIDAMYLKLRTSLTELTGFGFFYFAIIIIFVRSYGKHLLNENR